MATEDLCNLSKLPAEVWIEILKSDVLDETDLCNVSQVCRRLNEISWSNEVWKARVHKRWPKQISFTPEEGWQALYKTRKQVCKAVEQCVRDLAAENYHSEYVSSEQFEKFLKVMALHDKAWHFIVEELFAILDSPRYTRLTDKFYARKAVKFIQQYNLKHQWRVFLSAPEEQQSLETGARFVSGWMQATKEMAQLDITAELDSIADKVRAVLRSNCRGAKVHPACNKDNSITGFTESLWTADQNKEVLKAVNKVLYDDMGLKGNEADYYAKENSFIDEVLKRKKGIPITLSILYQAVARRLGVVCEPTNFPNHFLLAFRTKEQPDSAEEVTYIDAFNKGKMMTSYECIRTLLSGRSFDESFFQAVEPHVVFERMARNLVCLFSTNSSAEETIPVFHDAVSLFLAISPNDQQMIMVYTNLCLHLNINLREVVRMLQSIDIGPLGGINLLRHCEMQIEMNQQRQRKSTVKIRSPHPEVEFSVGMVMKHKRYHYTCVIYGWDHECKASREWIQQMGVHLLPKRQHQPFYNVLVEDGTNRYAAQENLLYTRDVKEIPHDAVGRYFQEFTGCYYVPNPSKGIEYPDDTEVTRTLMDRFFSSDQ